MRSARSGRNPPETRNAPRHLFAKPSDFEPDYAQARMNLAIVLFQQKRVDAAGYEFEYAIRVRPGYALGHFNYGLMLSNLQRFEEARSQMEAALRANPKYAEAQEELGKLNELSLGASLVKKGNLTEARQHLTLAAASSDSAIRESAQRLLSEIGRQP